MKRQGEPGVSGLTNDLSPVIGVPVARVRMSFIPRSNATLREKTLFCRGRVFAASRDSRCTWCDCIARLYLAERASPSPHELLPYLSRPSDRVTRTFLAKPTLTTLQTSVFPLKLPRVGISLFHVRSELRRVIVNSLPRVNPGHEGWRVKKNITNDVPT